GNDGTEASFIQWINYGWEQATSQPLHKIWKSPDTGDSGIDAPYIFIAPAAFPFGFDQIFTQPPFPKLGRPQGARGQSGFAFFQPWVNLGWEVLPPLMRRRQLITGIRIGENPAPFVPPPPIPVTLWPFDVQPVQPSHPRSEKWAATIPGSPGI